MVRRSLPAIDESATLPALKEGVIVDRDRWGRPWIRAKSVEDLVTAQGYVMAQDRLWQMDLMRRAAGGELAEIFGEVALDVDKENRTLGMRAAARAGCSRFVAGDSRAPRFLRAGREPIYRGALEAPAHRVHRARLQTASVDARGHLSHQLVHVQDAHFHMEGKAQPAVDRRESWTRARARPFRGGFTAGSFHRRRRNSGVATSETESVRPGCGSSTHGRR